MLAMTRFCCIEVLFLIFYYYWGQETCYIEDFVTKKFVKSRFHCVLMYKLCTMKHAMTCIAYHCTVIMLRFSTMLKTY